MRMPQGMEIEMRHIQLRMSNVAQVLCHSWLNVASIFACAYKTNLAYENHKPSPLRHLGEGRYKSLYSI